MYFKVILPLFLASAATLLGAHLDCAFIPTVGDLIALQDHGCRLDSPATGFVQRDFSYSAEFASGAVEPDPFSLSSRYFGGHVIENLNVPAGDILSVTFSYTFETGTDLLSLLSARLTAAASCHPGQSCVRSYASVRLSQAVCAAGLSQP